MYTCIHAVLAQAVGVCAWVSCEAMVWRAVCHYCVYVVEDSGSSGVSYYVILGVLQDQSDEEAGRFCGLSFGCPLRSCVFEGPHVGPPRPVSGVVAWHS